MKIWKQIQKVLFWSLILVLLVAPLGLLYQISEREMDFYATPSMPVLVESSLGEILQVRRENVKEFVSVSGRFVSSENVYQELTVEQPSRIRWEVGNGDEIQEGQVLGTYLGEPVAAQYSGIIESISLGSDPYIKIRLVDKLILECQVSESDLSILKRGRDMVTQKNEAVTLSYASNIQGSNGTYLVKLLVDSEEYSYNQSISGLRIYSGLEYPQVLVIDADCVYQKDSGTGNPWYVRVVTEHGVFVREAEVQISYTNGSQVCITGVDEGTYCDSGYKAIVEGGS